MTFVKPGHKADFKPPESHDGHAITLCWRCTSFGTCRFGLTAEWVGEGDGLFHSRLRCPVQFEGAPGIAHGGWVCVALDEFIGRRLSVIHKGFAVTAELNVEFLRPVPIELELEGTGRIDRHDGRRCHASGSLRLASADVTVARVKGVWSVRHETPSIRQRTRFDKQAPATHRAHHPMD